MKKQTISIRTKILVIIMILFSVLHALSAFTDILEYNSLIEGGFWVFILMYLISKHFDGKSQKNKDS
jgi:hypothetical protein